jgi:hypothetical protein
VRYLIYKQHPQLRVDSMANRNVSLNGQDTRVISMITGRTVAAEIQSLKSGGFVSSFIAGRKFSVPHAY